MAQPTTRLERDLFRRFRNPSHRSRYPKKSAKLLNLTGSTLSGQPDPTAVTENVADGALEEFSARPGKSTRPRRPICLPCQREELICQGGIPKATSCDTCKVQRLMCEWPPIQVVVSSRTIEEEPNKHSSGSRACAEQSGSGNPKLREAILPLGSSQTDGASKIGVVAGPSSREAELPYRSPTTEDLNTASAVERSSLRNQNNERKLDSNKSKRRQQLVDTSEQPDVAANNFIPEKSDCPDHVPSSNIPDAPNTETFDLSPATQNIHQFHAPQHVHTETATTCGGLETGIAPFGSSFSSADCETPSSSYDESLASDTADVDYETDSTDIDPRLKSIPGQRVAGLKQIIVDSIMKDFCSTFYKSEGIRVQAGNRGGDSNRNNDSGSRNTSNHAPSTQIHNMQTLIRGGGGRGDRFGDDEDNDGNQNQHSNFNFTTEPTDTLKLACPYHKRDPFNRAHHRSCRGSSWQTVARIKEHIYRVHRLPPQCQRCYLSFKSVNDLHEHSRSRNACLLQPQPANAPVGMNEHQEIQLKKRALFGKLTEVAKWTKMYQILFPDEDESMIPTPYYEDTTNHTIMQKSLQQGLSIIREVPRLMRVRVENLVAERFSQIENDVRFCLAMDNIEDQVRNEASEAFVASVARNANPYPSVLVANDTTTSNVTTLETLMNGFWQSDSRFAATTSAPGSSSPRLASLQPFAVTPGYSSYDVSSSARNATGTSARNPFRGGTVPSQPTSTLHQHLVSNSSNQFPAQLQETSLFSAPPMDFDFNGTSTQDDMEDDLI